MGRRHDAALQRQRFLWREHDANLAKAWMAQEDHQLIVLPDFHASDFDDVDHDELPGRIITLD